MWERFSVQAQVALHQTRELVVESGAPNATTEHLLVGILAADRGVVGKIIGDLGVSPQTLREEARAQLPPSNAPNPGMEVRPSVEAGRALEAAIAEADRLGWRYAGKENILLGILATGGTPAAHLLERHGITEEAVRGAVQKMLDDAEARAQ